MALNPTLHQDGQPFPQLDGAFTDKEGRITRPWQRFLMTLWQRTGSKFINIQNAAVMSQAGLAGGLPITIINALTGAVLGTIFTDNGPGGVAQAQNPVFSPFTFTAALSGTLVCSDGLVEISRNAGVTWYAGGAAGGCVPVCNADRVRITWTGVPPSIVFLPDTP